MACWPIYTQAIFIRRSFHFVRRFVMLRNFFAHEEGQGLVEYALILVLIAIVVIVGLTFLGTTINDTFSEIGTNLD
jgi:pilus assembly protein Flp/PilA